MANNCAMINQYTHIKIVSLRKKNLKSELKVPMNQNFNNLNADVL